MSNVDEPRYLWIRPNCTPDMLSIKEYIRDTTESGDWYKATPELWETYRTAVNNDDWDLVENLEAGDYRDFFYDP